MIYSTLRLLALLCLTAAVTNAQDGPFGPPIAGEINRDYFLMYFVDADSNEDAWHDPFCSSRTYDDSWGTDFALRSMRQMDSGVAVLAVADGVVSSVIDSLPDRGDDLDSYYGNSIRIVHGEYAVYYEHLRQGSVTVRVGDSVRRGEVIAQVGRSGYTLVPNLHVEVWKAASIVDPFAGPCHSGPSLWRTQPVHDTAFGVIDYGLLGSIPTIDSVNERSSSRTAFFSATDDVVAFWINTHSMRAGDIQRVEWYEPTGSLWELVPFDPVEEDYPIYLLWAYFYFPPIAGTWSFRYLLNDIPQVEGTFTVDVESSVDAAATSDRAITYDARTAALTIALPGPSHPRDLDVALIDITGRASRTLFAGRVDGAVLRCTVDEEVPVGTYVVRVRSEGERTMSRVIVVGE